MKMDDAFFRSRVWQLKKWVRILKERRRRRLEFFSASSTYTMIEFLE